MSIPHMENVPTVNALSMRFNMTTIQQFIQWCKDNPYTSLNEYPIDLWEQLDNWRQAIADVTGIDCNFCPPWQILKTVESAKEFFGPSILDDIQRTFNDL